MTELLITQIEAEYSVALAKWEDLLLKFEPKLGRSRARIEANRSCPIYVRFNPDMLGKLGLNMYLMSIVGEEVFVVAHWEDDGNAVWGDDFYFESIYHPDRTFKFTAREIERALSVQSKKLFKVVKASLQ